MDALTLATFFLGGFLLGCALASLVLGQLVSLHREDRDITVAERQQWRSQERELLNRILHPNLVPTGTERPSRPPDPKVADRMREWAQVGRVVPNGDAAMPATDELKLP